LSPRLITAVFRNTFIIAAEIFKKALLSFGHELPEDRGEREDILDKIVTDEVAERLGECDTGFYQYRDNLEELNCRYIIDNKEHVA